MREPLHSRAATFLEALEAALGGPGQRSAEVVAEVHSDLEAAVAAAMARGEEPAAAWNRALDDLGDPQELAAAMRGPLPPERPARAMEHARRAAAILVAGFFAYTAWSVRSWDYGDRLGLFFFFGALGFPPAVLLWPGIVWRWNALFSTANAVALLVLAGFLLVGGTHTVSTYELAAQGADTALLLDGEAVAAALPAETGEPLLEREHVFALLVLAAAGLVLSLIQQAGQRRRVLLIGAGALVLIDMPYTIEEHLFVREARHAAAWVEAQHARTGSWPAEEEFKERYEPLRIANLWYSPPASAEDETFSFQWPRYLQRSAGLGYHSDGTIWGND
jgi:hypothetical protein